jgi:hypothetical protein
LKATHPLAKQFAIWEADGRAKVTCYVAPEGSQVPPAIHAWAKTYGTSVPAPAVRWLGERYREAGTALRNQARLKKDETLAIDERPAWLFGLLEVAAVRCRGEVDVAALEQAFVPLAAATSPFLIIESLLQQNWAQAEHEAAVLDAVAQDESDYYGLLGALQWAVRSRLRDPRLGQAVSEWLAEWEMIAKNFPVRQSWLLSVLIRRWQAAGKGEIRPLLDERKLWLAHLARS